MKTIIEELALKNGCILKKYTYDSDTNQLRLKYADINKNSNTYSVKLYQNDSTTVIPITDEDEVLSYIKYCLYSGFILVLPENTIFSISGVKDFYKKYIDELIIEYKKDLETNTFDYNYFHAHGSLVIFKIMKDILDKGVFTIKIDKDTKYIILFDGIQYILKEYENDKFKGEYSYNIYNLRYLISILDDAIFD